MICDKCGKDFESGVDENGRPYGISFEMNLGDYVSYCAKCCEILEIDMRNQSDKRLKKKELQIRGNGRKRGFEREK